MVDTLLSSEELLRPFFTDKENDPKTVEKDMKNLVSAKLGASVATMFFASIVSKVRALMPEEIFADDANLTNTAPVIGQLSAAKKVQTCNLMLDYLKENIEFIMLDRRSSPSSSSSFPSWCSCWMHLPELLFATEPYCCHDR